MALISKIENNIYNMEFNINKFIAEYGVGGFLFLAIVTIGGIIVRSKWFSEWWTNQTDRFIEWVLRRKVKNNNEGDLIESNITNHDIFNYIDFWIYSKIPTFQFSTEYRTIIFKRYLSIFLKKYKEGLSEFVSQGKYQSMNQSELWKNLLDLINNIIFQYEKECENSGIPKIVIVKMKSKNNDTITLTIDLIESIINSKFYQSDKNLLKLYSILNIILSVLESTITNSEPICNSINGQLKGLKVDENGKTYQEP
jgi:hypothetical protein